MCSSDLSLMGAVSNTNLGKAIGSGLSGINWGSLGGLFGGGSTHTGTTDTGTGDTSGNILYPTDDSGGYTTSDGTYIDPNEYSLY